MNLQGSLAFEREQRVDVAGHCYGYGSEGDQVLKRETSARTSGGEIYSPEGRVK